MMLGFNMVETKLNSVSFYRYLINEGYYFDKEIIENYLIYFKLKFYVDTNNFFRSYF